MQTRSEIRQALAAGKKLRFHTWGANEYITLEASTGKLLRENGADFDTTFKDPEQWDLKPEKRRFSLYRHTFKDYDDETTVIYSEKENFADTDDGDDDANTHIKTVKIGDYELAD